MHGWRSPARPLTGAVAVVALGLGVLATAANPASARPTHPAVSPNPRGVNIVAGIHDTAINDCNQSGTLQVAGPTAPLPTGAAGAAQASITSPAFPSGVTTVRVTMPWDVADPAIVADSVGGSGHVTADVPTDQKTLYATRECLDAWLSAAFAKHLQPEIDFRADKLFAAAPADPSQPTVRQVYMPSLPQYTNAMIAFRNAYVTCTSCAAGGQVKVLVPWNEPDNQGQSVVGSQYDLLFPDNHTHLAGNSCPAGPTVSNCGAYLAGQLWVTLYKLVLQGSDGGAKCASGCTVAAADFSGGQGFLQLKAEGACPNGCPYLYLYNQSVASSGLRPGHWAVHPYSDIQNYQSGGSTSSTRLAAFAGKLKSYGYGTSTFIWINEISVCTATLPPTVPTIPGTCTKKPIVNDKDAAMRYLVGNDPGDLTLSVPADGPQVGRIDYYCFDGAQQQCNDDWAMKTSGTSTLNSAGQIYATWAAS